MRNRYEIGASVRIHCGYRTVCETWLRDPLGILQRATSMALSGLFGARLRVPLGPVEIASEIVVDVLGIEQSGSPDAPGTQLEVEWGGLHTPELFPTMRATMTFYPVTPGATMLELRGSYRPPFGAIGKAADAIAMHRVVRASVRHLLEDLARLLERYSSASRSATRAES